MCASGKKGYPTKRGAKNAAKRLRQYGWKKGHPYRCPECREWHLTTADAQRRAFHRRGSADDLG